MDVKWMYCETSVADCNYDFGLQRVIKTNIRRWLSCKCTIPSGQHKQTHNHTADDWLISKANMDWHLWRVQRVLHWFHFGHPMCTPELVIWFMCRIESIPHIKFVIRALLLDTESSFLDHHFHFGDSYLLSAVGFYLCWFLPIFLTNSKWIPTKQKTSTNQTRCMSFILNAHCFIFWNSWVILKSSFFFSRKSKLLYAYCIIGRIAYGNAFLDSENCERAKEAKAKAMHVWNISLQKHSAAFWPDWMTFCRYLPSFAPCLRFNSFSASAKQKNQSICRKSTANSTKPVQTDATEIIIIIKSNTNRRHRNIIVKM